MVRRRVIPVFRSVYKETAPIIFKSPHKDIRPNIGTGPITSDFVKVSAYRLEQRALKNRDKDLTPDTNVMASASSLINEYKKIYTDIKSIIANTKNDDLTYNNLDPLQNIKYTGLKKKFEYTKFNEIMRFYDLQEQIKSLTGLSDLSLFTRDGEVPEINSRERLLEKFSPGDQIKVYTTEIKSGKNFEFSGVVIMQKLNGYSTTFSVRNTIEGVSMEKTMFLYNPAITRIEVLSRREYVTEDLRYLRDSNPLYTTV